MHGRRWYLAASRACVLVLMSCPAQAGEPKEHSELAATVSAPFRATPAQRRTQARTFVVQFDHSEGDHTDAVDWRLILSGPGPQGVLQRVWSGRKRLHTGSATVRLHWDGLGKNRRPAPQGLYDLRLVAGSGDDRVEQQWQIAVERSTPEAPRLMAMAPPPALDSNSPYRIVYANLHSQTRHSA